MDYEKSSSYSQQQKERGAKFIQRMKRSYHDRNIMPIIRKKCCDSTTVKILEFGPGLGVLLDMILAKFPDIDYHVADIDHGILTRLRGSHPSISTHLITETLPQELLADPGFDIIIALDVWEHLPPSSLAMETRFCYSHLKSIGIMVLQVPNWGCPFTPNTIFAGDITHFNRFNEISLRQLLLSCDIPDSEVQIAPYRFPYGLLGRVREGVRWGALLLFRVCYGILGVQQLRLLTPNIIGVVRKGR